MLDKIICAIFTTTIYSNKCVNKSNSSKLTENIRMNMNWTLNHSDLQTMLTSSLNYSFYDARLHLVRFSLLKIIPTQTSKTNIYVWWWWQTKWMRPTRIVAYAITAMESKAMDRKTSTSWVTNRDYIWAVRLFNVFYFKTHSMNYIVL